MKEKSTKILTEKRSDASELQPEIRQTIKTQTTPKASEHIELE